VLLLQHCTLPTVYQTHFSQIVNRTPGAILCFIDGSNQNGRIELAFSIAGQTHMFRHRNTASVFTAELQTILLCLENIITQNSSSAPQIFLIISDSLAYISAISKPDSLHRLVNRIHILLICLNTTSSKVIFIWVPGHCGILANEAMDKAAKQATHLARISPGLISTHTDLSSSIHSSITKKWHQLWRDQKSSHNKLAIIKPTRPPYLGPHRISSHVG